MAGLKQIAPCREQGAEMLKAIDLVCALIQPAGPLPISC